MSWISPEDTTIFDISSANTFSDISLAWAVMMCFYLWPFCCFGTGKSCKALNAYHPHEHHILTGKVHPKVNILSPTHKSPATIFLPCNIKFKYLGCFFPYNEKSDSFVELQTILWTVFGVLKHHTMASFRNEIKVEFAFCHRFPVAFIMLPQY